MTDAEKEQFILYINDQYDLLIKKIAVEILKDDALIHDVKQQVLMRLMDKGDLLVTLHPKQVTAYVGTTTKRIAITEYHRRNHYETNREQLIESYNTTMTMDHIEFKAFEGQYGFSEEMWDLMMRLPELDRELLVCKYYYGMTVEQIAEEIGRNKEMVKKRLQRTRQKLADLIEKKGVDFR